MCTTPFVAKQRLGKHVPTATNACNNRRIVESLCLWVCLCIPLSLLGNNSVRKYPRQRRIVGGVDFYAVLVISKEIRGLVLPSTSCLLREHFGNWTTSPSSGKNFSWAQSTELVPVSGHQNQRKTGYISQTQHKTSAGVKANITKFIWCHIFLKVTWGWKIYVIKTSSNIIWVVKWRRRGWAGHGLRMRTEKCCWKLWRDSNHMKERDIVMKIILK
jgi:hypothetical protein